MISVHTSLHTFAHPYTHTQAAEPSEEDEDMGFGLFD